MSAYWIDVLNNGLIIAVFAVSLNVLLGYAGQVSVAPAGLGGIGGYLAGYLSASHGWAFLPALGAGVGAAFLAGLVLGVPALRLQQDYLILLTLAFATVVTGALSALGGEYGLIGVQPPHLAGGPLLTPGELLPLVCIVCAVCCLVCWRLAASPFGRVLRGIRDDEDVTEALGKSVVKFKVSAFAITAAIAGAGGVILVYYEATATPGQFSFTETVTMVAAVIVGGMGNLLGSFVGALALTAVGPVLQQVVSLNPKVATLWQLTIYGALLIVVMRVRPAGLIPEGVGIRRRRRTPLDSLGGADLTSVTTVAESDSERLPQKVATSGAGAAARQAHPEQVAMVGVMGNEQSSHSGVSVDASQARARTAGDEPAALAEAEGVSPATSPALAPLGSPAVCVRGLTKHFGGIRAVQDLSFDLARGEITALVGPNGAGKTTVFNLMTGRIRPDTGEIELFGKSVTGLAPHSVTRMGMVRSFQDVRILDRMSCLDNVALAVMGQPGEHLGPLLARPRRVRRVESAVVSTAAGWLEYVGLHVRAHHLARDLGTGEQKLLAIARLLATGADVLLVDEPASGIDRAHLEPVMAVLERLRTDGKTICIVEHNLDIVGRLATHCLFMENGHVTVEGTLAEITAMEGLADAYFGHV